MSRSVHPTNLRVSPDRTEVGAVEDLSVGAPRSLLDEAATPPIFAEHKSWADDPRLPACLISTIVHTIVLLLLALWTLPPVGDGQSSILVTLGPPTETVRTDVASMSTVVEMPLIATEDRTVSVETVGIDGVLSNAATAKLAPLNAVDSSSTPVENSLPPSSVTLQNAITKLDSSQMALVQLPTHGSLEGRTPAERLRLGDLYGATPASEAAVELALQWLAEHQRRSGAWTFDLTIDPCDGRCRNGKKLDDETPTPTTAATGLALLAFLGAGYTHEEGKYADVIKRGLYYLRSAGGETQTGSDWQHGSMYGHGIALMAVAEATAMTANKGEFDAELRELTQRGTNFTCGAQHASGSWGYVPGSPGDTTQTGWQVLSLVAARRCDIALPSVTLSRAKRFLKSTSPENAQYSFGYQGPPGEPTTTAIGITLMLYLGDSPQVTPFYNALTEMAQRGPKLTNVYHDYYATLSLHHVRHPMWDPWNAKLRDHLVATQVQTGHERGSWHFPDKWGDIGGRLYTTAMSAMILEIYYRYLPMYQSMDTFPL